MKTIVLLSGHYYNSKRKAGFHFISESLSKTGNNVTFITAVFSIINILRGNDYRLSYKSFRKNIIFPQKYGNIKSIINLSLMHPLNNCNRYIERFSALLYTLNFRCIKEIKKADVIIFESTSALLFFKRIKKINPDAKLIYRVSDDLSAIHSPRIVINLEKKILEDFDYVSVPSLSIYQNKYKYTKRNINIDYHGIDKFLFDNCNKSPYRDDTINLIFIGTSNLDLQFIDIASSFFSDYIFHIIGPFKRIITQKNVIYYGELDFNETVPFIKNATIGLHTIKCHLNYANTYSDSLKVIQYSYCQLPIIVPEIMKANHRENFFYYIYDDIDSIRIAIENALKMDRRRINKEGIYSWDDLAKKLVDPS